MKKATLRLEALAHQLGLEFYRFHDKSLPPIDIFYDKQVLKSEQTYLEQMPEVEDVEDIFPADFSDFMDTAGSDIEEDPDTYARQVISYFAPILMSEDYRSFIRNALPKLRALSSQVAVLGAHGGVNERVWTYSGGGHNFSVQQFINHIDGRYGLIFLDSCNPGRHSITAKRSVILVPNDDISPALLGRGEVKLELFIPGRGYVGDNCEK